MTLQLRYPDELPVSEHREEILAALRDHQVVIVAGETGSGKTTQLPKMCLELGRGVHGMVGHTQPRRIAARTVAERLAAEMEVTLGEEVGYTVRFTDRVGAATRVKVMTDGILLAEIHRDRNLKRYDTLIVDEAHERSLNIDFILGYLKRLLPRRPDLKVVITSATIDTAKFSAHFDGAPVVEVSGRSYPVEIRYRPVVDDAGDSGRDVMTAITEAVEECCAEGPGDILVFVSGEREIRDAADTLHRQGPDGIEVLPLYARLSAAEQHRVFQPHRGRRVVLATNVAETSLTVPGVRFVVDTGTARVSRYNRRTKVQRLPIEAISQASANQRAGRCGRVGPGMCVRLYSEEDFAGRPAFTEPEILRTNLASVILQMAAIGLGDIPAFPFVDAPDARNIRDGIALLTELGAFRDDRSGTPPSPRPPRLSAVGRQLAQLPIDPRLARMVVEADRNGCLREVLVVAAALSIQDPRERPADKAQAAAEAHARFADPDSDFFAYLNLWRYLHERQRELSSSQFRKLCRAEYLNYLRVREWQDLHGQLRQVVRGLGLRATGDGDRNQVHRSILAGLLSQIGVREGDSRDYLGARNGRFALAPGSGLAKRAPRWVMAAELVETNRMWARTAARIQPEWVERLAGHLVVRRHSEPQWDPHRGTVTAIERVTLYGVPIVAGRRVDYGRVDRAAARQLFIRHALVEGDWETHHAFFHDNQKRLQEAHELADRARRRDLVADEDAIAAFYDARVGAEVASARQFDAWWRRARRQHPDLLDFPAGLLIAEDTEPAAAGRDRGSFPDTWCHGDLELATTYQFEPGSPTDGVTVHIPLAVLNQVTTDGFDWQVPGLRQELVTALIRSLPKAVRRSFVPVPDFARAFLDRAAPEDGPLLPTLEAVLPRLTGDPIPAGSWRLDEVPAHLQVTFQAEDSKGRALAASKDLDALKAVLRGPTRAALAGVAAGIERSGLRAWTIGALPRTVEAVRGGQTVRGYPALVDEGGSVAVRVLEDEPTRDRAMWAGTRRLLLAGLPSPARALAHRLDNRARLALAGGPYPDTGALIDDCIACAVDDLMAANGGPAWDEAGFARLRAAVGQALPDAALATVRHVATVLTVASGLRARLGAVDPVGAGGVGDLVGAGGAVGAPALGAPALAATRADVTAQLERLIYPGFVSATGAGRLPHLARYLQAAERRLDKAPADPRRDRALMERVGRLEAELAGRRQALAGRPEAGGLDEIGWMIEELRVSFFAQALGTPAPVSEARIRRALEQVAA